MYTPEKSFAPLVHVIFTFYLKLAESVTLQNVKKKVNETIEKTCMGMTYMKFCIH